MSNENTQGEESVETSDQLVLVLSNKALSVILTSLVSEKVRIQRTGSTERAQKVKGVLDEFSAAWANALCDSILMNGLPT